MDWIFDSIDSIVQTINKLNLDLSDILSLLGIMLAIVSTIIAIKSLNFGKRSFLVKDHYDPVLNILRGCSKSTLLNKI